MSCFNGAMWIEQAITSVLNQSHYVDEFIIVNDGSTDNSSELIKHWSEIDARIIILDKENSGLADSLNAGISVCSSDWIARIDVDDIWHHDRIKNQLDVVMADYSVQFISGSMIEIDIDGKEFKHYQYPQGNKELRRHLLSLKKFPPHSSVMYKKSLVEKLGKYRGVIRRAEDHDLWLRISEVTNLHCCNKSVTYIRKHEAQISNESNGLIQHRDAFISVLCSHARSLGYQEPVNLSKQDFSKFKIELDEVLNRFQFYDFFLMTRLIKNILTGKSQAKLRVSMRHAFYYFYQYLFKYYYLKRVAMNMLKKS